MLIFVWYVYIHVFLKYFFVRVFFFFFFLDRKWILSSSSVKTMTTMVQIVTEFFSYLHFRIKPRDMVMRQQAHVLVNGAAGLRHTLLPFFTTMMLMFSSSSSPPSSSFCHLFLFCSCRKSFVIFVDYHVNVTAVINFDCRRKKYRPCQFLPSSLFTCGGDDHHNCRRQRKRLLHVARSEMKL